MLTFVEKIEKYLEIIKAKVKPATWSSYKSYLDSNIEPFFKNTPLADVNPERIQSFFQKMIDDGISPITVKPIRAFLNRAVRYDSTESTAFVSETKEESRTLRYYSRAEQKKLRQAAAATGYPLSLVINLALFTGMRVGEVSGLMWDDIDWGNETITVSRNIQRLRSPDSAKKTELIVTDLSGTASKRVINIAKPLLAEIKRCKEEYAASASDNSSKYVLSQNGKPLEPRYIQNHFRGVLDDAGMEHVNFNVLRDTFAVRAIEAGFNLLSLSKILGHGSTVMTSDRYASLYTQDIPALMKKLSEMAEK
jgi:integrase